MKILTCATVLTFVCSWAGICQPAAGGIGRETRELCELEVGGKPREVVRLRGSGRLIGEAFVLVDFTCPTRFSRGKVVERLVRIRPARFAREGDRLWFGQAADKVERPLVQLEAEGRIACVHKFEVKFDHRMQPVKGNGFGRSGLILCDIKDAYLLGIWFAGAEPVH